MNSEYIKSMIEDAESSIRDAKCSLEISRDFLKDQELSESTIKLQNALYELNKASELVVMALNKLGFQE